jgi:HK97 family phage portal protein
VGQRIRRVDKARTVNVFGRVNAAFKATAMVFSRQTRSFFMLLGRTRYDYAREVGTGRGNAALMAVVLWVCRTFPEAPIRILTQGRDGKDQPLPNHLLKQLLDKPNTFYSGRLLWASTIADWMLSGNAYWWKRRSGAGRVVELWWIPSTMIEPRWPDDGSVYISHYDYTPDAVPIRYRPEDVVHFRYGFLDPLNIRKGFSPVTALLRELFTDDEAANYTASMLRNLGVPPVVVQPRPDKDGHYPKLSEDDLEAAKAKFQERVTGDQRGSAVFMRGGTEVTTLGFNPRDMDVKALRRVPEERISAIFGTPAVVVGLGAGLDRSTFANFAEAREAAYESNVIPTQQSMASELQTQLLPDFGDPTRLRIDFDLSQVRVLQDDQNDLWKRVGEALSAGRISLGRYWELLGLEPEAGVDGDTWYIPSTVTLTPGGDLLALPEPAPVALPPGTQPPALPAPKGLPLRLVKASVPSAEQRLQRLRARLQRSAERKVAQVLKEQQSAVLARLGTRKDTRELINPDNVLPPDAERKLREALETVYLSALEAVHGVAEDVLGVTFDLPDPVTLAYLAESGTAITAIQETTRKAVREALQEGLLNGEGLSELANRIKDLPEFDRRRALLVARTELGQSSNRAAVHSYRASGVVVGIQVLDSDADEVCAALNGQVFPLSDPPPMLGHPNCVRTLSPVTDASELAA